MPPQRVFNVEVGPTGSPGGPAGDLTRHDCHVSDAGRLRRIAVAVPVPEAAMSEAYIPTRPAAGVDRDVAGRCE